MKRNRSESPATPTPGYGKHVRCSTCSSRQNKRTRNSTSQKNSKDGKTSSRFKKALGGAIYHRVRHLGRRLTKAEFSALCSAVRKQIGRRMSSLESSLSEIRTRITLLENLTPQDVYSLSNSISLLHSQVSILRQQTLDAINERDELSEGCGHFKGKRLIRTPSNVPPLWFRNSRASIIPPDFRSEEILACTKCISRREDACFLWFGDDLSSFTPFLQNDDLKMAAKIGLLKIPPLGIQSLWTSVLNERYHRNSDAIPH